MSKILENVTSFDLNIGLHTFILLHFCCHLFLSFSSFFLTLITFARKNTMSYDYSEESVKALLSWAKSMQLPKTLKLGISENIFDLPKCVQASINDIEIHYPNPTFTPAINRLYRIKEALESISNS